MAKGRLRTKAALVAAQKKVYLKGPVLYKGNYAKMPVDDTRRRPVELLIQGGVNWPHLSKRATSRKVIELFPVVATLIMPIARGQVEKPGLNERLTVG